MNPKVSIVLTVFNGEKYLEKSIFSVLSQSFNNFEFIIVDDGSTDKSLYKIKNINDPRIQIIEQKNQVQTSALINGIKKTKGELIARIDHDDYSLPNRLMHQVEFMNSHPGAVLCGSRWEELYGDDLHPQGIKFVQTNGDLKKIISYFNPFAHSAVMFRRDAYFKVGGYNKLYSIGMDFDLFSRLMKVGHVHNLDEALTIVRMHNDSISKKSSRLKTLECLKIRYRAYRNFGGNPLLTSYFYLKSILGLAIPLKIKKKTWKK